MKDRRSISGKFLYLLRQRDGDICAICNLRMLFYRRKLSELKGISATIDHTLEVSKGGQHNLDNLRLAHAWCNSGRENHSPRQLRRRVYRQWRKFIGLKTLLDSKEEITTFKKHLLFRKSFLYEVNLDEGVERYKSFQKTKKAKLAQARSAKLAQLKADGVSPQLFNTILRQIKYNNLD